MARIKTGLDYFPLVTQWDTKLKLVKAKYPQGVGIGIITGLFQTIYDEGYFIKWDDDTKLLFSADNQIDVDKIDEMVGFFLEKEIFNKKLYEEYQILTSPKIQKTYMEVCTRTRRKTIKLITNYLLIDIEEYDNENRVLILEDLTTTKTGKNVVMNAENDVMNAENVVMKQQKKRKENKRKERKGKDATKNQFHDFVFLSDDELSKLNDKLGEKVATEYIEKLDYYLTNNPKKQIDAPDGYKNHYKTILNWIKRDAMQNDRSPPEIRTCSKCGRVLTDDNDKLCFVCEEFVNEERECINSTNNN